MVELATSETIDDCGLAERRAGERRDHERRLSIDPAAWLKSHGGANDAHNSTSLALGMEALERNDGDVAYTLENEPHARAEVVIAHLIQMPDISPAARSRILAAAAILDMIDKDQE